VANWYSLSKSVAIGLFTSCVAARRLDAALEWLARHRAGEPVLVIAATATAAAELIRHATVRYGATFGWTPMTLGRVAATLAAPVLTARNTAPVGALAVEAVVARVLHTLEAAQRLGRYAHAARGPGFARACTRTLTELRLQDVAPARLKKPAPELHAIAERFAIELEAARLADRAAVLRVAAGATRGARAAMSLLGIPTLLWDLPLEYALERALVDAIVRQAPDVCATAPSGDRSSQHNLSLALRVEAKTLDPQEEEGALRRLQRHLFEETAPAPAQLDDRVTVFSAPGESRECVEIARRLLGFASSGVPFDRMAIALRSPAEYRSHLGEALSRAEIPAHFAVGAIRPHPAGRAFVALLDCAAERLSAARFAEYLSLSEVPAADPAGKPPAPPPSGERWVPVEPDLLPAGVAPDRDQPVAEDAFTEQPETRPVIDGTLRAPRRWERLIVDAAVIGGLDRWTRRLDGLDNELRAALEGLEDPDDPQAMYLRRDRTDLAALRAYALPLLEALQRLPARALWGNWLDHLSALAAHALRHPDAVLAALGELAPMAEVGPVGLDEVRRVLAERLLEVTVRPPAKRFGCVFVAPIAALRGLSFDVVFVPGLAERLLPRKIGEEPILLDEKRKEVQPELLTNTQRVAQERLALRLAIGAAGERIVLSYPRLDLDQARPRVPSFYALEAVRAATGRLPGFSELAREAELVGQARIGWPAPRQAADAIDEAEHDLALLEEVLHADADRSVGAAHYLLAANPHLGRALRFRARRWLRRWTVADGLVDPQAAGRDAMAAHRLDARSYSPTALEKYAACPYRFFLYAVHKLAPREVPQAIEEIDPLQRGSLVHEVQFALFQRLQQEALLPIVPATLEPARAVLDEVLDRTAHRFRDDLVPAVDRVWQDGIESVRVDLRDWLRRMSEDASGWVPWRFELAFGLADRHARDAHSVPQAVQLDGGLQLRGSIDLVERRADGALRATDHKTGKAWVARDAVVDGGTSLQPLFYALALEKIFPDVPVDLGRLYYCTTVGGFEERPVHVNPATRRSAARVVEILREAIETPFLPAAPDRGACRYCDYRVVCGPYEEQRTGRKPRERLRGLDRLRGLP
jgi:CRISPR/Cas system-associated exonuclease Cas4 (RecB family)